MFATDLYKGVKNQTMIRKIEYSESSFPSKLFPIQNPPQSIYYRGNAAVDAGFCEHERQIGQTGTTVRPKLYIACGISGQIQHTAGMEESAMVIAINTDSNAPINKFADYVITGDLNVVIPKMIQYYKKNSK